MFHILAWLTGGGRDSNDVVFHKKKKKENKKVKQLATIVLPSTFSFCVT